MYFLNLKRIYISFWLLTLSSLLGMQSVSAINYSCSPYSNTDIVSVAPYNHPVTIGGGNYSASGTWVNGFYYRDFITLGNTYRFRQSWSATSVKLYFQDQYWYASGVYIKVWRKTWATFDLVTTSENILPSLWATGAIYTVNFSQALTGIQEWDYYWYRIEANLPPVPVNKNFFFAQPVTSESWSNFLDQSTVWSSFAWETEPWVQVSPFAVTMEFTMTNPDIALIGDSIIAGHPTHYSYVEKLTKSALSTTIGAQLASLTSYITHNVGIWSQTTSQISARFPSDVLSLKPKVIVIEWWVNDIYGWVITSGTFATNITNMVSAAEADPAVQKVVLLGILPWTNGTTPQNTKVDERNTILSGIAAIYSKATYVSAAPLVGQFRSGGPIDNLWDIQPVYNLDWIHFNAAWHGRIAQALRNVICDPTALIVNYPWSGTVFTWSSIITSWTASSWDVITIFNASGVAIASGIANTSGVWSIPLNNLSHGAHVLSYRASDASGNVSSFVYNTVTIDLSPIVPICTAVPNPVLSTASVVITCTNIASGNTVIIPGTTCIPIPSTGGNVVCSGTGSNVGNNPVVTVTNLLSLSTTWIASLVIQTVGGWGGWWSSSVDNCPDGDFSPSYQDGICGTKPVTITGSISTGVQNTGWVQTGVTIPDTVFESNNSTSDACQYVDYKIDSFLGLTTEAQKRRFIVCRLYTNKQTMFDQVSPFEYDRIVTREEASRMIGNFVKNILNKEPIRKKTDKICRFTDLSKANVWLVPYIKQSCEYGVFNGTYNHEFLPNEWLNQAHAIATVLRASYGYQDEQGNDPWFTPYTELIQEKDLERRGFTVPDTDLMSLYYKGMTRGNLWEFMYRVAVDVFATNNK
jgi:lysophospholipase L1-like esterase